MSHPDVFLVTRARSGAWDFTKPMEEQPEWTAHAELMDAWVRDGVIVLGGPIAGDREAVLVLRARDAQEVERILSADPWTASGLLQTTSIRRWTIRLGSVAY